MIGVVSGGGSGDGSGDNDDGGGDIYGGDNDGSGGSCIGSDGYGSDDASGGAPVAQPVGSEIQRSCYYSRLDKGMFQSFGAYITHE